MRIAGRRPHPRMRLLPGARPDVDVAMGEVLALPGERPVMAAQRLVDQVDRLPVALDIVDRIGIGRRHLGAARLDEAELEPAAGDDVGGGILLGDAHRLAAQRDQRAEAQDACLACLPREDADQHRVRADQRVDAGVVLGRADVEAHVVAQQIFVDHLLEEIGRDPRVAVPVGQARRAPSRRRRALPPAREDKAPRTSTTHPSPPLRSVSVSRRGTRKRDRPAPPAARSRGDARRHRSGAKRAPGISEA